MHAWKKYFASLHNYQQLKINNSKIWARFSHAAKNILFDAKSLWHQHSHYMLWCSTPVTQNIFCAPLKSWKIHFNHQAMLVVCSFISAHEIFILEINRWAKRRVVVRAKNCIFHLLITTISHDIIIKNLQHTFFFVNKQSCSLQCTLLLVKSHFITNFICTSAVGKNCNIYSCCFSLPQTWATIHCATKKQFSSFLLSLSLSFAHIHTLCEHY